MKKFILTLCLIVFAGSFVNAQKFAKKAKKNDLVMTRSDFDHVYHLFPEDNPNYVWKNAKKGLLLDLPKEQYETLLIVDSLGNVQFVNSVYEAPRRQDSVLFYTNSKGKDIIIKNLTTGLFHRPITQQKQEMSAYANIGQGQNAPQNIPQRSVRGPIIQTPASRNTQRGTVITNSGRSAVSISRSFPRW